MRTTSDTSGAESSAPRLSGGRAALSAAGLPALLAVLLLAVAGRWDWPAAWAYAGLMALYTVGGYGYLARVNPALLAHRARIGKGTKTWDKIWLAVFTPPFLAVYGVAALDAGRFGWSAIAPHMAPVWWLLGLALLVPGTAVQLWAMGVNPFFEKTVRIQSERGHRVIDTGPYAMVRHPGYAGILAWILGTPLLLGSWWAFAPAVIAAALLAVRTALEDRTLRRELPGYAAYAARVRFRLIPYLW